MRRGGRVDVDAAHREGGAHDEHRLLPPRPIPRENDLRATSVTTTPVLRNSASAVFVVTDGLGECARFVVAGLACGQEAVSLWRLHFCPHGLW